MAVKNNNQIHPLPKQQGDVTTMPIDPDSPDGPGMKSTSIKQPSDLPIDQITH